MLERKAFYIDGIWAEPPGASTIEVIDPATEKPCAVISAGTSADVDRAVAAAWRALPLWRAVSPNERLAIVQKLLEIYARRASEVGDAIRMEMGAPIDLATGDQAGAGLYHIQNFIDAFEKIRFEHPFSADQTTDHIIREPIGVVGLITPWNWPMNQIALKVVPALLAGCTVVFKPSEIAPLSGMLFAEFLHEAGVPPGAFNLVNGEGVVVGRALSGHKDVAMVSFTGSTRAGADILRTAADTFKRVSLELGGKGANIVFADAGVEAVERGVRTLMVNAGQSCDAPSRMLVERAFYDQALVVAAEVATSIKSGPSASHGDHMGPVVSRQQYDRIQDMIEKGVAEGARLISGGTGRPAGFEAGYYVRPTVFADVNMEMTIAREEIFGPVLCIIPFDSEEEAIGFANDTNYGLTNYIESSDIERCKRLARAVHSGMVVMNGVLLGPGTAFGGVKASGGGREGGVTGIEEFLQDKSISGWA